MCDRLSVLELYDLSARLSVLVSYDLSAIYLICLLLYIKYNLYYK